MTFRHGRMTCPQALSEFESPLKAGATLHHGMNDDGMLLDHVACLAVVTRLTEECFQNTEFQ